MADDGGVSAGIVRAGASSGLARVADAGSADAGVAVVSPAGAAVGRGARALGQARAVLSSRVSQPGPTHDLFAVLRLIEAARPDLPRLGRALRPGQESVRLGQDPSMAFAAGAVASIEPASSGGSLATDTSSNPELGSTLGAPGLARPAADSGVGAPAGRAQHALGNAGAGNAAPGAARALHAHGEQAAAKASASVAVIARPTVVGGAHPSTATRSPQPSAAGLVQAGSGSANAELARRMGFGAQSSSTGSAQPGSVATHADAARRSGVGGAQPLAAEPGAANVDAARRAGMSVTHAGSAAGVAQVRSSSTHADAARRSGVGGAQPLAAGAGTTVDVARHAGVSGAGAVAVGVQPSAAGLAQKGGLASRAGLGGAQSGPASSDGVAVRVGASAASQGAGRRAAVGGQRSAVGGPLTAADGPLRVLVHCFGMLGPNGPLPLHLTEYVWQRLKHHGDRSLARFLDLFHHRMLSFLYRAWVDANPAVGHDRPETDRLPSQLGAFLGIGTQALRERDALGDSSRRYYAGQLSDPVAHPEGLRALIEDHFGVPAQIEELVGEWAEIPEDCKWRMPDLALGPAADSGRLGLSTTLGSRVWLVQNRFRVVLGPLSRREFNRVSPGGPDVAALTSLIRGYVGDGLRWDIRLRLLPEAVPTLQLGAAIIGQTSWLWSTGEVPRDDLIYEPLAPSPT